MTPKTEIKLEGLDFYLGLGFLNMLIDETGKQLHDFADMHPVQLVPTLMYYSRKYACECLENGVDVKKHHIYKLIDDNGGIEGHLSVEFMTAFGKAMHQDVPVEDKKKVTAKKK